ncbi:SprT family zinc-dependent metalloprotease [Parashewanella spongiae]|uniref:SprT family zinc-dependent metalloprotease n=1 Tax=Parashewanella spongiae TaxID=342950 RepID=UPI001FB5163B|nr:SprT family zinc-dependent metalloprotease [Parashewanella spongiae]MCL1078458.1 SprT family zinc-dependent metalloprotease [Parashewanella spongiae]
MNGKTWNNHFGDTNLVMETWQAKTLEHVEHCYRVAEQHLKRRFTRPEVSFKLRGRSAGMAHLQLNKLRFNQQMLTDNQQVFIDEVVPHEICHLLCHQLYGRVRPHGREWQAMMLSLFECQPKTTHNFTVHNKPQAQFNYQCLCGIIKLSIRRHNKVIRNQAQYRCKTCKQTLQQKHY